MKTINIKFQNSDAEVCGWGSAKKDDESNINIEYGEHAENLHCMPIVVRSGLFCRNNVRSGDFRNKLMCGHANRYFPKQITTMVITLQIFVFT